MVNQGKRQDENQEKKRNPPTHVLSSAKSYFIFGKNARG
jgi:hypothetical protein